LVALVGAGVGDATDAVSLPVSRLASWLSRVESRKSAVGMAISSRAIPARIGTSALWRFSAGAVIGALPDTSRLETMAVRWSDGVWVGCGTGAAIGSPTSPVTGGGGGLIVGTWVGVFAAGILAVAM